MIIDYSDMVEYKEINDPEHQPKSAKNYAVYIKTASREVGKFPIDTKDDVEKAIIALSTNKSLPDTIKKTASYFVKQAAHVNKINFNFEGEAPESNIIPIEDIMPKEIEKSASYDTITIDGYSYNPEIASDVTKAMVKFASRIDSFPAESRIETSKLLAKLAFAHNLDVPEKIKHYTHPALNKQADFLIALRRDFVPKEELATFDKFASVAHSIPAADVLSTLQTLDHNISFVPHKAGHSYYDMISPDFDTTVEKKASLEATLLAKDAESVATIERLIK